MDKNTNDSIEISRLVQTSSLQNLVTQNSDRKSWAFGRPLVFQMTENLGHLGLVFFWVVNFRAWFAFSLRFGGRSNSSNYLRKDWSVCLGSVRIQLDFERLYPLNTTRLYVSSSQKNRALGDPARCLHLAL